VKKSGYAILLLISTGAIAAVGPHLVTIAYVGSPNVPASLIVAVGYGDTERGVGAYHVDFPSPWCGTPGVQFVGSSTNYNGNSTSMSNCIQGDWDGGAILVTNEGSAAITLTNLTVVLPLPSSGSVGSPSCAQPPRPITFHLWFGQQYYYDNSSDPAYYGSPTTVPPGGQVIFAGTSSDGAYVCPSGNYPEGPVNGTYDFDTSDSNFLTGCAPTGDTVSDPRITLAATGYAPTTYIDAGHVIDTGGIDPGMCNSTAANPEWPNESLGWRLANSTCGESCPENQFAFTESVTSQMASSVATSSSATSSASGATATYAIAGAGVVVIVAAGLYALRRRRPSA